MSTQTIDLSVRPINFTNQIPLHLQGSAEEALIRYQNFAQAPHRYNKPRLLIVTDIDHRIRLRIPERFAYVIRTGAADLRGLEFQVASILALGHISSVALIGIEDSIFSKVERNKETLARNLENYAGWEEEQ